MTSQEVLPGDDQPSRRQFLQLLGGTALAAACRPPTEKILPYPKQPREAQPGKAVHYATSLVDEGLAFGILVESHQGRPTKIEGNGDHPASLGATSAWHQAAVWDLYSPGRARLPTLEKQPTSWDRFVHAFGGPPPDGAGAGLHFVLQPTSSPLRISLIDRIRERWRGATFHFHRPFSNPQGPEAIRRAFGSPLHLHPQLDRAEVIACFDADLFGADPMSVRFSHDFANGRRIRSGGAAPNRLYVAEGDLSLSGAIADHRLRVRPGEITAFLHAVVREVATRIPEQASALASLQPGAPLSEGGQSWVRALAADLIRARGRSVVWVGARQPLEAQLLCHLLNAWLDAPVVGFEPVIHEEGSASHGLEGLVAALEAGAVTTLVWLEGDPVADAPGDLQLSTRLKQVPQSVAVGLRQNATTDTAQWFLPSLHPLEQWGDARAFDGTVSFIQPLIRPLYDGHGPTEVLATFAGEKEPDAHGLLRSLHGARLDDASLALGLVSGSATPPLSLVLSPDPIREALRSLPQPPPSGGLEISLLPDPRLGNGGGDANDWLVELPHPITTVCWENPAHLSPATMKAHGLRSGDWVELQVEDRRLSLPVVEVPGVADGLISLALGWGRSPRGKKGEVVGVDAHRLRSSTSGWLLPGASATRLVGQKAVAGKETVHTVVPTVQHHMDMQDRPILREQTLSRFLAQSAGASPQEVAVPSLYPSAFAPKGIQWGMSIDLNVCTGCASCVIACQAENNIPTVGRIGVLKGRHMHWLRIDRYRLGADEDDIRLLPQPMLCQHCEKAPCEYVCPVNATVHSPDGLNEMVYNRCIGTRFCSNNCPYKVRRFNWLEYNSDLSETEQMQKNPNVTVRARGVMEKCTYCVQRIRVNEIDARIEGRQVRDGDVVTACQAACPTRAIVFGPVSDPGSEVSKLHAQPHSYLVLQEELGTLPRTRYLAHLANVNEENP